MKKYCINILFVLLSSLVSACYDYDDVTYEIGEASDQAFISKMEVYDRDWNKVTTSTSIPVTMIDQNGVERFKDENTKPEILLEVKSGTDLTQVSLVATLSSQSSYAKISPNMGIPMDMTAPREFTVVSQSGKNVLVYKVTVVEKR